MRNNQKKANLSKIPYQHLIIDIVIDISNNFKEVVIISLFHPKSIYSYELINVIKFYLIILLCRV